MKNVIKLMYIICGIFIIVLGLTGCFRKEKLVIVSGSENKALEPILRKFEKKHGVKVEMVYKGSVDMMMQMKTDEINQYDAVWPANSLWISMGDIRHKIKHVESVMTSPIVFGVKKSLAIDLGLVDKEVAINDLLDLIEDDRLNFMMTSATQSNSGACAYIGFINALLGNTDVISIDHLHEAELRDDISSLLGGINRSSGSSGWLKELFLQGDYDAMVNYEALLIEANNELLAMGKEPLYAIYPYDGLAVANSPLGYVNKGDKKKEEAFLKLQQYLLSDEVQQEILGYGRRTGFGGTIENADQRVFNPDWGINASKTISGIRMPSAEVIEEALNLYQTEFKKPSLTVYCLDYSGSMDGEGEIQLKQAMEMILNQKKAGQYFLQATSRDVTIVIPFSDQIKDLWVVEGNDEAKLNELIDKIQYLEPNGGTDIYTPTMFGIETIGKYNVDDYIPAVVLMSDGDSNTGAHYSQLCDYYRSQQYDIPVFSILFGNASEEQLEEIAQLTRSRVFDGKENLINAFKKARGYN